MLHGFRHIVAAAALPACLLGCRDDGTDPDPTGAGDVHGTVASVKTGQGVSNLVVALTSGADVVGVAATDADGTFRFDGIAAGEYVARLTGIELSGLSPNHTAFEPPSQTVRVGAGDAALGFGVVGLIPPRVTGDVTCAGMPAVGALVRVIGGATDIVVSTNEQGRYGATDLGPGHHAVLLIAAPCDVAVSWTAVELLPGQAAEVDFSG